MATAKNGTVPAVDRAIALLELMAESNSGLSISKAAHRLGAPKSSIYLIMSTLESKGYLRKDLPSRKYSPGHRLSALATLPLERFQSRQSQCLLAHLAESTGLTAHMAVLIGNEAVITGRSQPTGSAQFGTWVGQRMHLHCSALGKALLAFLPEAEFENMIQGKRLFRHNQYTISTVAKLREEMSRVRAGGYSIDNEEEEIGVRCVGVPVFDYYGKPLAAISVVGTTAQIPLTRVPLLAKSLRDKAQSATQIID